MIAITLKPITAADLEFARTMRNANRHSFIDNREVTPEQQQQWFASLQSKPHIDFRIIWHDGIRIGTMSVTTHPDGSLEIGNGTVLDEYRGKGVATAAESMLSDPHVNCWGTYFADNPAAATVMQRSGFQPILIERSPVNQIVRKRPRIAVVGDVMLDVYRVGTATRISPEAPVPVVLNPTIETRLGGAGAVAAMCQALGAEVILMTVTGRDRNGEAVDRLATQLGIGSFCLADHARPTTTKERICGLSSGRHRQQLGRIDYESTERISNDLARTLATMIRGIGHHTGNPEKMPADAIIVADYSKGVCTHAVIDACRLSGVPVFVDPCHPWMYNELECIVPNREESSGDSASTIRHQLNLAAAIVKLDQDGCQLDFSGSPIKDARIPSRVRSVHDVTGAGDQFIAALTCARAAGLDWFAATEFANTAAGLQVERHGCVPVTIDELRKESVCQSVHA